MPIDSLATPPNPLMNFYNQNGVAGAPAPASPGTAAGMQGSYTSVPPPTSSGGQASSANGPSLVPGGQAGAATNTELSALLGRIKASAGNAVDFLARAMVEQEGQQRHEAVQDRTNMRMMAQASLMAAAHDLDKQANDLVTGAIVNLVVTVVMSAASMAMSFGGAAMKLKGMSNETKALKGMEEMESVEKAADKITIGMRGSTWEKGVGSVEKAAEKLEKPTSKWSVVGGVISEQGMTAAKLGESAANFGSTMGQAESKMDEAQEKIDEANAQQYDAQADIKKAAQDALDDMVKQIISFLKDLKDAKAEQMAAITRG